MIYFSGKGEMVKYIVEIEGFLGNSFLKFYWKENIMVLISEEYGLCMSLI